MAGELWRGHTAIAVEGTYGLGVPPTRKTYFTDPAFEKTRAPRPKMFATGTRDNTRAFTLGPVVSGAKNLKQPLSADEIIELLLMGVRGGVTPAGGTWVFTPSSGLGSVLDSATFEWFDGARPWQIAGCLVNKLAIKGSVDKDNDIDVELFGKTFDPLLAVTDGLADRVPSVIEGWESTLYVDDIGTTPGSTIIPGTLINWDVTLENQLGRKYFADNTLNLGAVVTGAIKVTAKLTFEAASDVANEEFSNWDGVVPRLVTVNFGNNNTIGGVPHGNVAIDIPGYWESVDLSKSEAQTRVYELTQTYCFDPGNGFGVQVRVTNARGSAWGA